MEKLLQVDTMHSLKLVCTTCFAYNPKDNKARKEKGKAHIPAIKGYGPVYYPTLGLLCRRALVRPSGLISPTASRLRLVRLGPTSS